MAISEFGLIQRYFGARGTRRADVSVGIGDDGAVLRVPEGQDLVVTTDTLVRDVHFPRSTPAHALGHKSLAVNLSDLAAMGAEPSWATLALTLPKVDEDWLKAFSEGFFSLASDFNVDLVGGDIARGPLSITAQLHGFVPRGGGMRRSGARPGDRLYVTGTLGDAAIGLELATNRTQRGSTMERAYLLSRLHTPLPRVSEGLALRDFARAAIDLSDGLAADVAHLCRASGAGASIWVDKLPLSDAFRALTDTTERYRMALGGGDDYELCLAIPAENQSAVDELARSLDCSLTQVGIVERNKKLRFLHDDGSEYKLQKSGYQHFRRKGER